MHKNSLAKTNPYLQGDPAKVAKLVRRHVDSSCGVEGIKTDPKVTTKIQISSRGKKKIHRS